MYKIQHRGKRFGKKTFTSYEEARSYTRKVIRKYLAMLNIRGIIQDVGMERYNNPAINMYGFTVVSK